jgi:hypothetical protein
LVAAAALVTLVPMGGCWTRSPPSEPREISGEVPELKATSKYLSPEFKLLRWSEGLNLLVVDALGFRVRVAMSGRMRAGFYHCEGSAENSERYGSGYKWELDTPDGKRATFKFGGKEYDLSEGTLFVIKANGDNVEVRQLNRHLPALAFDKRVIAEYLKNDSEVRKIVGVKDEEE